MSAITIMAINLCAELGLRGVYSVSCDDCAEILRSVIDSTATVARAYETSHPALKPPSGRATDGGCIRPGDASAVDFRDTRPWTAYLDGAGEP